MKQPSRFCLICLVVLVSLALYAGSAFAEGRGSAPTVDGFADVPWGGTVAQADKAMAGMGFEEIVAERYTSESGMSVTQLNGRFADRSCKLVFAFTKNVFNSGQAVFREIAPDLGNQSPWYDHDFVTNQYQQIKALLVRKHGQPSKEEKSNFMGRTEMLAKWTLTSSTGDEIALTCWGVTAINKGNLGFVKVVYLNNSLNGSVVP